MVSVTFLAAYGGNAPNQVVRVNTSETIFAANILGGHPATLDFVVEINDRVVLNPVFPCQLPVAWEPENNDSRKYCYGIGNITVRVIP